MKHNGLLQIAKLPSRLDYDYLYNNFQYFCEIIRHRAGFAASPYPEFIHRILWEMQQTITDDGYEYDVLLELPRGHGKTTVIVAPFVAWRLLRAPSMRVAVFSAGKTRANIIASNAKKIITKIFPDQYHLAGKPTATALYLKHHLPLQSDPSLTSFPIHGMGSVGSRADLIVADDVYTSESADTVIRAAGVLDKYEDLPSLYGEKLKNQRITVGTRLGFNDLYDMIHRSGTYKILRFPVIRPEDEPKLPPPPITKKEVGDVRKYCIWPNMMTDAKLIPAYNSPRIWNTQYMLRPPQSGNKAFLVEQIMRETGKPRATFFKKLAISIDPAMGNLTRTVGDLCAIVVGGLDQEGHWHLIDGWAKRDFNIDEVGREWKNFLAKYKTASGYPTTFLESSAQQALMKPILRQYHNNAPIFSHSSTIKKNFKIAGFITPVLTTNRLHVWDSPISKDFISQLDRFDPQSDNNEDDIIDAFAMLLHRLYHLDRALMLAVKEMGIKG